LGDLLVLRDEGKEGEQQEEKAAEKVQEEERTGAFKIREEHILVVDESPVKRETKGNGQAELVPRKQEAKRHQGNEQEHVDNRYRELHLL
jgi:hypothetical protein